ncbi:hypothetical protein YWS52_37410 [Chitiniphilus shinanonensis]
MAQRAIAVGAGEVAVQRQLVHFLAMAPLQVGAEHVDALLELHERLAAGKRHGSARQTGTVCRKAGHAETTSPRRMTGGCLAGNVRPGAERNERGEQDPA